MDLPEPIKDLQALQIPKHRRIWKPFMLKYDCQSIVEVGVFRGENFNLMIEHNPRLAVAVDSWINDGTISRNDSGLSQERLDEQYECFRASVVNKPFVRICRKYSKDAATEFKDEMFDLIYIDGDHTYEGCSQDLQSWYPKIRKNGYLTGDDYYHNKAKFTGVRFNVVSAVNDFAKQHNLTVYELPRHGWAVIKI